MIHCPICGRINTVGKIRTVKGKEIKHEDAGVYFCANCMREFEIYPIETDEEIDEFFDTEIDGQITWEE
jgi:uncharacterized protein YlaI